MTSDAKVGLLLGLVFIFIIAFIINGLPSLRNSGDGNELTRNMARPRKVAPGIATGPRKTSREVITPIEPVKQVEPDVRIEPVKEQVVADNTSVRFRTELPKPRGLSPAPSSPESRTVPAEAPGVSRVLATRKALTKPAAARIYTVEEGDSLAAIAQKFYGPEEGNKLASVERIFRANRKILKSADEIYVGQKIVIPPLSDTAPKPEDLPNSQFKPAESIGRRHLTSEGGKSNSDRYYIVKEGDSLWAIASRRLGDGNRYPEIAKLNACVLEDEDYLPVGLRLKLPAR